ITLLFFMGNNCFAQTFGGGSGNSASDPYLISTKAHLDSLAIYVNRANSPLTFSGKYFRMDTNINMTGSFTPIGKVTFQWGNITAIYPFQGNFNGNGHKIKNLTISGDNYIGLFGYIQNATIENIGIDSTCTFTCTSSGEGS